MENGLTTDVKYVRAVDADTIEFKVERTFKVRLRDFDAVELSSLLGEEARDFVDDILQNADKIQIFIPSNDPEKLMDLHSFERLVADVIVDDKNLIDLIKVYEKPKPRRSQR